jgi:hypothetical protein
VHICMEPRIFILEYQDIKYSCCIPSSPCNFHGLDSPHKLQAAYPKPPPQTENPDGKINRDRGKYLHATSVDLLIFYKFIRSGLNAMLPPINERQWTVSGTKVEFFLRWSRRISNTPEYCVGMEFFGWRKPGTHCE